MNNPFNNYQINDDNDFEYDFDEYDFNDDFNDDFDKMYTLEYTQEYTDSIELPDGTLLIADDMEVDYIIIKELNDSMHNISKSMESIAETYIMLGSMINDQGEDIDIASKHINESTINTDKGLDNLEKAGIYVKSRLIIVRDMAIVIGGGLLGGAGFILGPIVGIGTVIGGVASGGALVAGIHKASNKN